MEVINCNFVKILILSKVKRINKIRNEFEMKWK